MLLVLYREESGSIKPFDFLGAENGSKGKNLFYDFGPLIVSFLHCSCHLPSCPLE